MLDRSGTSLRDPAPWDASQAAGLSLLTPTALYVNDLLRLRGDCGYKGAVHVTGGGFYENLPRVLPAGLGCTVDSGAWEPLPIFQWLQGQGVPTAEAGSRRRPGRRYVLVCACFAPVWAAPACMHHCVVAEGGVPDACMCDNVAVDCRGD